MYNNAIVLLARFFLLQMYLLYVMATKDINGMSIESSSYIIRIHI